MQNGYSLFMEMKLSYCLETARRESLYSFWDTGRGNDNLDWNDFQINVLQGYQKWHQSKASVYPIIVLRI